MRVLAHIISVIFHPIFVIAFGLWLQMTINPFAFAVSDPKEQVLFWASVISLTVVFPLVTIVMLKTLGLVSSFQMDDRKERIGPLISTGLFYLWLFINIKNYGIVPEQFVIFVLGAVISLFIAFFINNFTKISLHTSAIGGLLGMAILAQFQFNYETFKLRLAEGIVYELSTVFMLFLVLIIAGLVGSARMVLGAHDKQEIYGGYLIGLFGQLVAFKVLF